MEAVSNAYDFRIVQAQIPDGKTFHAEKLKKLLSEKFKTTVNADDTDVTPDAAKAGLIIKTNSPIKAAAYLNARGLLSDPVTCEEKNIISVQLKEKIDGFSIKLQS